MTTQTTLLEQSSRIALAAFLHDLGKFAERARIEVETEQLEINKQLYCPHRKKYTDDKGWFTHVHAAYTAIAMDLIEEKFPDLIGKNVEPFASWKTTDADDSFINAAAKHHRPDTFLQWIIATADRVASGFDREQFEQYNQAEEGTETKKNHYTARQLTLFEQVRLESDKKQQHQYRYPLKPLSPESIFPVKADEYEQNNNEKAQQEYLKLWQQFTDALEKIPASHRANWELWLDHFETLWGVFTHAIPSATAFNARPDVSLYDHSRVTAAIATALWRYHDERKETDETHLKALKEQTESWQEDKFILIQGDFFGIQDFIFASGGETNKRAAKLLRGRSFYVSLLTECAALKVLDALELPSTSQVINAAGKFMIVAANTEHSLRQLQQVQQQLNEWFLQVSYGQAGIGLAWQAASCNDFRRGKDNETDSPYRKLIKKLFAQMEVIKAQRYQLCNENAPNPVFSEFLDQFNKELDPPVCQIDGKSPAFKKDESNISVSKLALDQIKAGHWLTRRQRILITENPLKMDSVLGMDIFGFHIAFVQSEDIKGKFGQEAKNGNLRRAWDFSLPKSETDALWNGYARRCINAYVPIVDETSKIESEWDKYRGVEEAMALDDVKTLNHIACDDRQAKDDGHWLGIRALTTLKGDVDNLGLIFEKGLPDISFSKTAALSRQMNAFFSIYFPWLCQSDASYKNSYTVFAGGDDFFLVGPWLSQIKLADTMRQAFQRYVTHNPELHFSAGLSTHKPGMPITQVGEMAEQALERAKAHNPEEHKIPPKNAVTCFNQTISWEAFNELTTLRLHGLQDKINHLKLSTGYVYGLLTLIDMQDNIAQKPENALWHSYFAYRTARMLEKQKGMSQEQRKRLQQELAQEIALNGIEKYRGDYRITLFCHLYQQRD